MGERPAGLDPRPEEPRPPPETEDRHNLELEALRLSLSNMHTAHLELTQLNLQKEKETALVELRDALNDKHAQDMALLQKRQHVELENIKEQHLKEREDTFSKHRQEIADLRTRLEVEKENHVQIVEALRRDWQLETDLRLKNLREELTEGHQAEIENVQKVLKAEFAEQRAELEKFSRCKDQAEQWREQLLLRTSHVEEIKHLKQDFELQLQQVNEEHETELEQLRLYFEQKLRDAEGSYSEDLNLLHQRLQEMKEDSLMECAEVSSSVEFLEETAEKERKDLHEQLMLQLEQNKEGFISLQLQLEEKHKQELESLRSSLALQKEDLLEMKRALSDRYTLEIEALKKKHCLELERLRAKLSEEHIKEITKIHLQCVQDTAGHVKEEGAENVLENDHRAKLLLLQSEKQHTSELKEEIEHFKRELQDIIVQHERHLKEELEKVKGDSVEDNQNKRKEGQEDTPQEEEECKEKEDLRSQTEEKLSLMLFKLERKAEFEKQAIRKQFELREAEMKQLQDQQATQILELEKSLKEQQNSLRQLEDNLAKEEAVQKFQVQYDRELEAAKALMAKELEDAKLKLQEDSALKFLATQKRFLEEGKEMSNQFSAEQEAVIQELEGKHATELQLQNRQLQEKQKQDTLALVAELRVKHQSEMDVLQDTLRREHRVHIEAQLTESQVKHAAEIKELEDRHLANLDSLESSYLSEIQTMQNEHRQALERLRMGLEEQLQEKDSVEKLFAEEMEKLKLKQIEELQLARDDLKVELASSHSEKLKAMAAELEDVHKENLNVALQNQRCLLEEENHKALDKLREEVLNMEEQHQKALQELQNIHVTETEKQKEEYLEQLQELSKLREQQGHDQKLHDQILSLNAKIEETTSELEKLQQRRKRENQEGANLISMLRSDIELSQNERKTLQETNQRLLNLFGETIQAVIAMKSHIHKKIGHCLEGIDSFGEENYPLLGEGESSQDSCQLLDETLPGSDVVPECKVTTPGGHETLPECGKTLLEHEQISSVAEISSHLCESFFMNPEGTLECEQPVKKIYQSLGAAVDNLLEMILDSTKQLEETREIHSQFEKEFNRKNEEIAQVVKQHKELVECLNEESTAKNQLTVELHKAEGIIEGYRAEKAALEEMLSQKEKSEHHLVVELENLKEQFQLLTYERTKLGEERNLLLSQKEALAAEAEEREVGVPVGSVVQKASGLLKKVECLAKEQTETKKQSEKDRSTLLSQMKVLEVELEDQLSQNQELAKKTAEIMDLKQQIVSLDKHLRNQRQFMDEQAIEREHERDEFQHEIKKLEEQLKYTTKFQSVGEFRPNENFESNTEMESLQRKLRDKSDELNELIIKKELADRQLVIQKDEIKILEETNAETLRKVSWLQEELDRLKKIEKELKQDREALQEQQLSTLIQISTLQSKLDEVKHLGPVESSPEQDLKEQLKAEQDALHMKEREVLSLEEQLEQLKNNLLHKNEDMVQLNLQLDLQNDLMIASVKELREENTHLKAFLQDREQEIVHLNEQIKRLQHEVENAKDNEVVEKKNSEIEELKSLIENLQENQERLRRDKVEEVEQLHEVIEKLQKELSVFVPEDHEISDSQDSFNNPKVENLQSELEKGLLGFQEKLSDEKITRPDSRLNELQEELKTVSIAKEALGQLLKEKQDQHKLQVESLKQSLQNAEDNSTQQLSLLRTRLSLRDSEVELMTSRIQEFEDILRAKETIISERELEIDAMSREKIAHFAQLEDVIAAFSRLHCELEKRNTFFQNEPPELQMLRSECVNLHLKLQMLNQKLVTYQMELDKHQACGSQCKAQVQASVKQLDALSTLKMQLRLQFRNEDDHPEGDNQILREQFEAQHITEEMSQEESEQEARKWPLPAASRLPLDEELVKNRPSEDFQFQKANIIKQVKQLEEKLKHLVSSATFKTSETQDVNHHQQVSESCEEVQVLKNGLNNISHSFQAIERSPLLKDPILDLDRTSFNPFEVVKSQDSASQKEISSLPIQKRLGSQHAPLVSKTNLNSVSPIQEHSETSQHFTDAVMDVDLTLWSSPEVIRKDSLLGYQSDVRLTPFSDVISSHSTDLGKRNSASSVFQNIPGLLDCPHDVIQEKTPQSLKPTPKLGNSYSADSGDAEAVISEKDDEDSILTPSEFQDDLRSTRPIPERESDGYDSSNSLDLAAKPNRVLKRSEHPDASLEAYLRNCEMVQGFIHSMKDKEMQSRRMKTLLKMVHDESHQILALSENEIPPQAARYNQWNALFERFQRERQGLLEAVKSLRKHLTQTPQEGAKDSLDICFDWRGEFLQAVEEVFEKERDVLKNELQSNIWNPESGDKKSLFKKLENIVKEQGEEQKKVLEHLHVSDRSSLLSEIQALKAQLRMTHLQNQEKLQQLHEALTNVEDHGNKQEYQLRRQELLDYKLQQETCIANDLQKSLEGERERVAEIQELLVTEQTAVKDLKSELCECKQEKESLLKTLRELQKEVIRLRSLLESKEKDLFAAIQEVQSEQLKGQDLQNTLEREQHQYMQREELKAKTLEELKSSLDIQHTQNNQLSIALKHEQMAKENLKKELQIEYSRCEALLFQERNKLLELQKTLETEKNHSAELSEALNHERVLTEQLSKRANETCALKEAQSQQTLLRKLKEEKSRTMELQAALEKAQQQAIRSKKKLEAEIQMHREEIKKEKERQLEVQHQRDEHKIKELQQMLVKLEEKERNFASTKNCPEAAAKASCNPDSNLGLAFLPDSERFESQQLEKIRQQLLYVAVLLTNFINQTIDRTINDWSTSNDKAVFSLLHTLEELKSELCISSTPQKTAQVQISLVDSLLKENGSLTKTLTTLTQEKVQLTQTVHKLEKTLKHHLQKGCGQMNKYVDRIDGGPLQKPEKNVWKRQKISLKHAEPGPVKSVLRNEPSPVVRTSNVKVEKLYLHFLRAESFRKALIYQKRYLLLLIGGFQESEQETLSMISRLGVFPSKADHKAIPPRPFTKFRTAVRVVIAILRLRFLVKKWQAVDRKGVLTGGTELDTVPGEILEVTKQPLPDARDSPPTRDVSLCHTANGIQVTKPQPAPINRFWERSISSPSPVSEKSVACSQDPERSLTEYIHHLEIIQQRLGGAQSEFASKNPAIKRPKK
ncbi:pericentrin isoform X2 [Ornithorhynchus anatinus]|uniref:pericentrin isoform X2 n=1 Tax=Ornithorhynchus anatinus TaxID=9258 RepID=UPI0010A893E0|nr:pericentrin isoform X2 [Ornithorhynchus anatinus]